MTKNTNEKNKKIALHIQECKEIIIRTLEEQEQKRKENEGLLYSKIVRDFYESNVFEDKYFYYPFFFFLCLGSDFRYNIGFFSKRFSEFQNLRTEVNEHLGKLVNEFNELCNVANADIEKYKFQYDELYFLEFDYKNDEWIIRLDSKKFSRIINLRSSYRNIQVFLDNQLLFSQSTKFCLDTSSSQTLWANIQKLSLKYK